MCVCVYAHMCLCLCVRGESKYVYVGTKENLTKNCVHPNPHLNPLTPGIRVCPGR